jgi:hypothetical protein
MARCATPVAAGIVNTRKTGNNAARHFSLVLVQGTSGTGRQPRLPYLVSLNSSLPISIRLISEVPAPIS